MASRQSGPRLFSRNFPRTRPGTWTTTSYSMTTPRKCSGDPPRGTRCPCIATSGGSGGASRIILRGGPRPGRARRRRRRAGRRQQQRPARSPGSPCAACAVAKYRLRSLAAPRRATARQRHARDAPRSGHLGVEPPPGDCVIAANAEASSERRRVGQVTAEKARRRMPQKCSSAAAKCEPQPPRRPRPLQRVLN